VRTSSFLVLAALAGALPSTVIAADHPAQAPVVTTQIATPSGRWQSIGLLPRFPPGRVVEPDVRTTSRRQPSPPSGDVHSFGYSRLGYGAVLADQVHRGPAIGFGYRGERDSLALDVSFLNFQLIGTEDEPLGYFAGSFLKLEALHLTNPNRAASAYFGGGASWGGVGVGRSIVGEYRSGWSGGGLQGELTAGYEFLRTSSARIFVQANATLPMYITKSLSYTSRGDVSRIEHRYVPSLVASVGVGLPLLRP
jgi:hypothetical protein